MLSWAVTLRSTLRRTRKSHAIRLFRAPSFTSSVSSYPPVSPSPIFRTFFQVPYPASPLFAILTKTPGVWGYSSHFGTARAVLPTGTPYIIQVLSFHVLAHSFALFCIRKKINSLCFQAIPNSLAKTPGVGGASLHFFDVWTLERWNVQMRLLHPEWGYGTFPHPSHCSQTPLVPQSAKVRDFFAIRGNNSAPPGV